MPDQFVSISLSSFGADAARSLGQGVLIQWTAAAGASHAEVREELFDGPPDLPALRQLIDAQGLTGVYSSPLALWPLGERRHESRLAQALASARACGAQWLKVSLGHFSNAADLDGLAALLTLQPVQLLVENDQTVEGGRIEPMTAFFAAVEARELPIGMTFDIGNWAWQDQSAEHAAQALGRHVRYVHCKGNAVRADGKRVATPPDPAELARWSQLLRHFAPGVPLAIEYPLLADDLLTYTRTQVDQLAQLGRARQEHAHV